MTDRISPQQFHEAHGVDDWRVIVGDGAVARFRTGSFRSGLAIADAIGTLADAASHAARVDLTPTSVTVRLSTFDFGELSGRDLALARDISVAARELAFPADPGAPQRVQITIDAMDIVSVIPFWRAVLGYEQIGDEDLVDPRGDGAAIWFQQMDTPRPQRNRLHIDVYVPHDQVEARVAAALAAGGRIATDRFAPVWWVLADSEGNECCVASWPGRD